MLYWLELVMNFGRLRIHGDLDGDKMDLLGLNREILVGFVCLNHHGQFEI